MCILHCSNKKERINMNKKISNNVLNVLALLRLRGIGKAWIIKTIVIILAKKI